MRVPDEDMAIFEGLDGQRRRINEDFDLLVQRAREGAIRDADRARLEAQQLQVKHEGIIRDMLDLLRYT
jgi:hypothetical protein